MKRHLVRYSIAAAVGFTLWMTNHILWLSATTVLLLYLAGIVGLNKLITPRKQSQEMKARRHRYVLGRAAFLEHETEALPHTDPDVQEMCTICKGIPPFKPDYDLIEGPRTGPGPKWYFSEPPRRDYLTPIDGGGPLSETEKQKRYLEHLKQTDPGEWARVMTDMLN